jgi:hypothetical protein
MKMLNTVYHNRQNKVTLEYDNIFLFFIYTLDDHLFNI